MQRKYNSSKKKTKKWTMWVMQMIFADFLKIIFANFSCKLKVCDTKYMRKFWAINDFSFEKSTYEQVKIQETFLYNPPLIILIIQ